MSMITQKDGEIARILFRLTNGELAKIYEEEVPEWAQNILPEYRK